MNIRVVREYKEKVEPFFSVYINGVIVPVGLMNSADFIAAIGIKSTGLSGGILWRKELAACFAGVTKGFIFKNAIDFDTDPVEEIVNSLKERVEAMLAWEKTLPSKQEAYTVIDTEKEDFEKMDKPLEKIKPVVDLNKELQKPIRKLAM